MSRDFNPFNPKTDSMDVAAPEKTTNDTLGEVFEIMASLSAQANAPENKETNSTLISMDEEDSSETSKFISMDEKDQPAESKLISMDLKEEKDDAIVIPTPSKFDDFINKICNSTPVFNHYINIRDQYENAIQSPEINKRLVEIRIKIKNMLDTLIMSLAPASGDPKVLREREAQAIKIQMESIKQELMAKFQSAMKAIYGDDTSSVLDEVKGAQSRYRFNTNDGTLKIDEKEPVILDASELSADEKAKIKALPKEDREAYVRGRKKHAEKKLAKIAQAEAEKRYAAQLIIEAQKKAEEKAKAYMDRAAMDIDEKAVVKVKPKEEYELLKFLIEENLQLKKKSEVVKKAKESKEAKVGVMETKEQENARLKAEAEKLGSELSELMTNIIWYLTINPGVLGDDYTPWDILGPDMRYVKKNPSSIIFGYLGCDIETITEQFDASLKEDVAAWLKQNVETTRQLLETVREKTRAEEKSSQLKRQLVAMEKCFPGIDVEYDQKVYNGRLAEIVAVQSQMKDSGWVVSYQPWSKFEEYVLKRFSGFGINIEGSGKLFPGKLSSEDLKKRKQLHQGGFIGLWSGGMNAPMLLVRQKCDPDVFCPDAKEFDKQVLDWQNQRDTNAIGFFYSIERKQWEAFLITEIDGNKDVTKVVINRDSPFLSVLKSIDSKSIHNFDKKKLKYLLKHNELFEGHPVGSQWMRAIVAFGATYQQYDALRKKVTRPIKCMQWDLEVQYPKDKREFDTKLEAWRKSHDVNSALFMYSPAKKNWESYLITSTKKELEQKAVDEKSPLMAELKTINAKNIDSYDKGRLNRLMLKEQARNPHFSKHNKVMKVGKFEETIDDSTVVMRSITEESLFNINTTVNDTMPFPSATILPRDSVVICDTDQDGDWFDFIILNEKGHSATFNPGNRVINDGDVRVRHSGDQTVPQLNKPGSIMGYRQHIVMWPRQKGSEGSHVIMVSASYNKQMTKAKRRADIYVCQPSIAQNSRLMKEMDAQVASGNCGTMNPSEFEIVDELTRNLESVSSVPSVEPFAESGAWGVLMASVYYSPRHQRSFLIKWNMPLTFQVSAKEGGYEGAKQLMQQDLQPIVESPEFQKYLDQIIAQEQRATIKPIPTTDLLSKPLSSLHWEAVNLAIQIGKEPGNVELQIRYAELYRMLSPILPMQDLVSILNSDASKDFKRDLSMDLSDDHNVEGHNAVAESSRAKAQSSSAKAKSLKPSLPIIVLGGSGSSSGSIAGSRHSARREPPSPSGDEPSAKRARVIAPAKKG